MAWLSSPCFSRERRGFDETGEAAGGRRRSVFDESAVPPLDPAVPFYFLQEVPPPHVMVKSLLTDELCGWICLIGLFRRKRKSPTLLWLVGRSNECPSMANASFHSTRPRAFLTPVTVSLPLEPTWLLAAERAAGIHSMKKPTRTDPPPGAGGKRL